MTTPVDRQLIEQLRDIVREANIFRMHGKVPPAARLLLAGVAHVNAQAADRLEALGHELLTIEAADRLTTRKGND